MNEKADRVELFIRQAPNESLLLRGQLLELKSWLNSMRRDVLTMLEQLEETHRLVNSPRFWDECIGNGEEELVEVIASVRRHIRQMPAEID